ncbi:hypothetical protein K469DRAFT_743274 [Zopfia rhizophila CBS 207.26]|uniref:Uncharacterized protein n=1 Tax=Zopfia rhizophila CBS 207.26 TaxID=1314779 RepID=A0A6A6D8Y1_9PEZI|nr:hypothetical protein K469DRAFT_743274 [Zopfia rhizophila CBS 207.26]
MIPQTSPSNLSWYLLPSSPSNSTCRVHLLQVGSLNLLDDLVFLPGPNEPNGSIQPGNDRSKIDKLENLPPASVEHVLPQCDNLFSYAFDHVGDGAKVGYTNAELGVRPTCCTITTLSDTLPTDGSRKVVEAYISNGLLEKVDGLYKAIQLRDLGDKGWFGLGTFDRAFDVLAMCHQMMLFRVKTRSSPEDDFVLLAGDCYHHPSLLKEPRRTVRPPYSKFSMHSDPDQAIDTIARTKPFAEKENVWVVGAHDYRVDEGIAARENQIEGLIFFG